VLVRCFQWSCASTLLFATTSQSRFGYPSTCITPHSRIAIKAPWNTRHLLPTAPETPWALKLPSQLSLGTCLEPLPPRSISCNTALNLNSAPARSPYLPARCSCSCHKRQGHQYGPRRFSVSGACDPTWSWASDLSQDRPLK
jgi:hypothetical protein